MMVMEEKIISPTPTSPVQAVPLSRQQILETTARCLTEEGYDATTIRRIAAKLDCAVGSIYRYFRDKRDLLDVVAQSALEPVALKVEAGAPVESSARQYHKIASSDLAMYRLMFWVHTVGATEPDADVQPQVIRRIIAGWTQRLGDESLARRSWMTLHGGITLGMSVDQVMEIITKDFEPRASTAMPAELRTRSVKQKERSAATMLREPVKVEALEKLESESQEKVAHYLASEEVVLL